MRKLVLKMSLSVDGFVGGPKGKIDWIFKTFDETATAWTMDCLWAAGVHIMGSRTYRDMAAWWPTSTEPFARPMNEIPEVIFSRRGLARNASASQTTRALEDAARRREEGGRRYGCHAGEPRSWIDPPVAGGDLGGETARLKREPGKDILAHGGAGFAQSLVKNGLIDEYKLLIHPVALGSGLPLSSTLPKPLDLRLVNATAFPSGAAAHLYRPV